MLLNMVFVSPGRCTEYCQPLRGLWCFKLERVLFVCFRLPHSMPSYWWLRCT
jgi:hypothetical protein